MAKVPYDYENEYVNGKNGKKLRRRGVRKKTPEEEAVSELITLGHAFFYGKGVELNDI